MHPRELLEANLATIERAIAAVCAQASLRGADADDFAGSVKLALVENDYAILRKWEGRSSFATYITVVVRRLLVDCRRAEGRWYASAAAKREGEAAVLFERLLTRDRRTPEEAMATVQAAFPGLTAQQLAAVGATARHRPPRPRLVALEEGDENRFAARDAADAGVAELDLTRRSRQASRIVQAALAEMSAEDRLILRLRYAEQATIADIARALDVAQRPLYRRVELLLTRLRRALEAAGLDATSVGDLIGAAGERLDFFGSDVKTADAHPSILGEGSEGLS